MPTRSQQPTPSAAATPTGTIPLGPMARASRRWRHRALVVEGMGLLTMGTVLQKWVPMTKWSRILGEPGPVPRHWAGAVIEALPARVADRQERSIAVALKSAARHLPWHSTCLAEATAGQVLLRQMRMPGVVVIGLRATDSGPWSAHAWLLGAKGALTGGPAARGFTATTVFEVPGGLRSDDIDLSLAPSTTASGAAPTGAAPASAPGGGAPGDGQTDAGGGALAHPGLHRLASASESDGPGQTAPVSPA